MAAKKTTKKRTAAKAAGTATRKPAEKATKKAAAPKRTRKAKARAAEVNLGHIFQLRPRVNTSFKPDELRAAKQALEEEGFASVAEAARAVAEKALELNRQKPGRHGFRGP